MAALGEVFAMVAGSILGIICLCGLGWFLVMVIAPLGWAIALVFVGLLIVLICLMSIIKTEPLL